MRSVNCPMATIEDLQDLPNIANGNAIVRTRDLAEIRPTLRDPDSVTRLDGNPAVAIEVSKRSGANLIETVDQVKLITAALQDQLPPGVVVSFSQDKLTTIRQLLSDLQNSVLTAVILVFIIILYALSVRSSILIGLAIPSSFLMGILSIDEKDALVQQAEARILGWPGISTIYTRVGSGGGAAILPPPM